MKQDVQKICHDCQKPFWLTGKERDFFVFKKLLEPSRCKPCRQARKPLRGGMYHPLGGEYQVIHSHH